MTVDEFSTEGMSQSEALDLALTLAGRGLPVFPIAISWDDEKGNTNKRPLTANGFYNASTDLDTVRLLFRAARLRAGEVYGVGVHPGPAGFVVLDVDVKNGHRGDVELAELEARYGELPPTVRVITASNGGHVWLRKGAAHVGNRDLVEGEIEIRADAGYVVAPGTVTPWGSWEVDGGGVFDPALVADWPDWVPTMLGVPVTADLQQLKQAPSKGYRPVVDAELHPADLAALQSLRQLGGHSEYVSKDGALCIVRPGKKAGTSASVGYIAPGVVNVFTSSWSGLPAGRYDADELELLAGGATVAEARAAFSPVPVPVPATSGVQVRSSIELDELLALPEPEYDFIIPGLIERRDRLILTGSEGHGKSTLARQLAVQAASGLHPFTLENIEPIGVLVVDTENTPAQVRRKLPGLRAAAGDRYAGNCRFDFQLGGIDLTTVEGEARLRRIIEEGQTPDLVIIGPLYKLQGGDPKDERTARAVATALDRVRDDYGCALVIEAHTPYAEGAKVKRPERPYGASLWSRWPEFGIFLASDGELRHWRPDRDARTWPAKLCRSAPWPWMVDVAAVPAEEWNGPRNCMASVLALLDLSPGVTYSGNELVRAMKAHGTPYHERTIRNAAEQLALEGAITVHVGPRRSRLYSAGGASEVALDDVA